MFHSHPGPPSAMVPLVAAAFPPALVVPGVAFLVPLVFPGPPFVLPVQAVVQQRRQVRALAGSLVPAATFALPAASPLPPAPARPATPAPPGATATTADADPADHRERPDVDGGRAWPRIRGVLHVGATEQAHAGHVLPDPERDPGPHA